MLENKTQKVDDLSSKISDIANITTYGESSYASVQLNDVNESEPIMLKAHPTTTNISYLYPRNNLYPSNNLFMTTRIIRFTRIAAPNLERKGFHCLYSIFSPVAPYFIKCNSK